MKKLFSVLIFVLLGSNSRAQLPDNKLNLSIGHSYCFFHGSEMAEEGTMIAPSLFSNYNQLMGFTLKCFVKQFKFLSVGVGYSSLFASDWEAKELQTFEGSKLSINAFSPLLQFHTQHAKNGIFNKLKLNTEIGASLGPAKARFESPVLEIHGQTGEIPQPMTETGFFYGIVAGLGFEEVIRNQLGIFVSYNYHLNWIKPRLYADNRFSYSELALGFKVQLARDKHLYN